MKKKGFTLIELLAVIVILAIIAVIITPMILGVIEKAKKGSIENSTLGYIDAIEKEFLVNELDESKNVPTDGTYSIGELTANYKGKGPDEGTMIVEKGEVKKALFQYEEYYVCYTENKAKSSKKEEDLIDCSDINNNVIYKESILNGAYPSISDDLIPITIEEDGTVKKANLYHKWYSYKEKKWANAVILEDKSITYEDDETIPEENIESYFVWIPRYRYKIWNEGNYDSLTSVDSSQVKTIEIIFEDKNTNIFKGSKKEEWLTHPAFTSFNTNGMWVGKFETSSKNGNVNEEQPESVRIKPNVTSWRNINVSNAFYTSYNYKRNLDSHMMKNTEWGAVAYLQHSKYGSHTSVRMNNNGNYITGSAAIKEPTCGFTNTNEDCNKRGTSEDVTKPYNTEIGVLASTTGNITGIYDMSGGAHEYVMGVVADSEGNPLSGRSNTRHSGFTGNLSCPTCDNNDGSITSIEGKPFPESKYYDLYLSNNSSQNYQNRILGDATGEMGPFGSVKYGEQERQISSWYADEAWQATSTDPWIVRGGTTLLGSGSGIFTFVADSGRISAGLSFRVVLSM